MSNWQSLIERRPILIGMVHLAPLPGSPRWQPGELAGVCAAAAEDARQLAAGGVDALLVENFGDCPFFPDRVPPVTVAAMTRAAGAVAAAGGGLPVGVNVLRCDPESALAVAAACGAAFIRVNVHIGAALTDQGLIQGRAHLTARARAAWAPEVAVLADVAVKHARPLGVPDVAAEGREALERGLADGIIVSGQATGAPLDLHRLARVRRAVGDALVLAGSGVTAENAARILALADGAIVGTALKRHGRVGAPVERARVEELRRAFDRAGRRPGDAPGD